MGSWVREEAMIALTQLIRLIVENGDPNILSAHGLDKPDFYQRYISALLQQLMEKIDRIREIAGK